MEESQSDKTYKIIGCCMEVHKTLGAGFLESVYQEALSVELAAAGVAFVREHSLKVQYKGRVLDKQFFADFVCYDSVIVETKAVSGLAPEHYAQVLNYLKATGLHLALLVNFGSPSLQYKRVIL